jgi:Ca2+-binding EF-hand superfamily protein
MKVEVLDGKKMMKELRTKFGLAKVARDLGMSQSHLTNVLKSPGYRVTNPIAQKLIKYVNDIE